MLADWPGSIRPFSCGALLAAMIIAATGQGSASAREPVRLLRTAAAGPHPALSRRAVLAETLAGRLLVISPSGRVLERIPGDRRRPPPWAAMELAPDRRHVFVSNGDEAEPPSLYELNLGNGRKRFIAHGISPTLSSDRSTLAYLKEGPVKGIEEATALVLRDLRTNTERSIPFVPPRPAGTPPEQLLSWSPDGRLVALVTTVEGIALVDPTTTSIATSVTNTGSNASIAGLAPAFVDTNTLVVLANCCIGRQRLVAVDTRSGARSPIARLSSPPVYMHGMGGGKLLVFTTMGELVVASRHRMRVIAKGIGAAAL